MGFFQLRLWFLEQSWSLFSESALAGDCSSPGHGHTLTHHRVQRLREHLLSGLTVLGDSRFTPFTPRHGPEAGAAITTHMLLMWPWTLKTGKWCSRGHSEGPGRANVEAGRSGFRPPFPAPWSRGQTLGLQTQSRAWPAGPPHLGDIVALEF